MVVKAFQIIIKNKSFYVTLIEGLSKGGNELIMTGGMNNYIKEAGKISCWNISQLKCLYTLLLFQAFQNNFHSIRKKLIKSF